MTDGAPREWPALERMVALGDASFMH